ncbi:uncharacterized protein DUF4302 [Mucilaginibacter gracilis]|uniref:Uncharacterized protein DUF4302 n=2 Tax=Mucilaginibacter gracilis TaxID=423350 RepID=A0A495IZL6_9SPHI|nr:uncharacterized protein DUF4302 [Mucilaginibacter gracilis]
MLALTVFTACKKSNTVATQDLPEVRVAATLSAYSKTLTGSSNGWKAFLYPYGGGVYLFSMKFGTNNRVTMLSDINATTSSTPAESSYLIRQQQAPSLLFDTYNYIHLLADPDPSVNGGLAGEGAYSDFEFYIDNVKGDTVNLIGNRLGSKMMLVKAASASDFTTFTTGTNDFIGKFSQLRTYFKRVTIGGVDCEVKLDIANKILTFSYLDASGNLAKVSGQFFVDGTNSSLVFVKPFTIGTVLVSSIKSFAIDATNHVFSCTINGTGYSIREAITPLKLDLTAAQRWYNQMAINSNGTWTSTTAFHYGVDDYCGFKNITGYSSLWYAGPVVFGGTSEGLIAFVNSALSSPYALSKVPFTVNAGIARFTLLTNAGTFTAATNQAIAMTSARNLLYGGAVVGNFQDWYLIQTDAGGINYDMVRATDAQVWISWKPRS